jgi:hypothetical protein
MLRTIASLKVSSDQSGTPVNNPLTGDEFSVVLTTPIKVPHGAQIMPIKATSWHTSPNISVARSNNQFSYTAAAPAPNPGTYQFALPDGLYAYQDIQDEITNVMIANGHGALLTPVFTFSPLFASGKMQIVITALGYSIDFTIANSIRDVIGFGSVVLGPPGAVPTTYTGGNKADFPQGVLAQIINMDLAFDSYIGGTSANAVFTISLASFTPNSTIREENYPGFTIPATVGYITKFRVWLSDQAGRRIGLNGNTYSLDFNIVTKVP